MKKTALSSKTLIMLCTLGALLIWLCLMIILRSNTAVCEYVCRNFVSAYQSVAGRFYSLVGFNVFEVLATIAVLGVIGGIATSIALFCKKRRAESRRVLLGVLIAAVWIANLYTFCAGFAYNREDVPLTFYSGGVDKQVAQSSYAALVDDFNACYARLEKYDDGRAKCPYTDKQLCDKIRKAVDSALTDDYFYPYTPAAKPIVSSGIMSHCRIAGITFLPTVEPGYNKDMPMTDRCSTIAHEYAHAKGVMLENEAEIISAYVLLNSGDDYLKYCAYIEVFSEINNILYVYYKSKDEIIDANPLNAGYVAEVMYSVKWWSNKNAFDRIGEFFNSLYLKFNGQKDGTGSYYVPPVTEEKEEIDDDGNVHIYFEIKEFSRMQNMIIGYYQSALS